MTQRSRWRARLARTGAVVLLCGVVVASLLGAIEIVRFLGTLISDLVTHAHVSLNGSLFQDLYSTLERDGRRHPAADKIAAIGAVFTALFTLMLWAVTGSMGRASHRQAAGDSPLLRVDLSIDSAPVRVADEGARTVSEAQNIGAASAKALYPQHLRTLDKALFERNTLRVAPHRYVRVRVQNVQAKPFAVARDIVVTVVLDAPALRGGMRDPDVHASVVPSNGSPDDGTSGLLNDVLSRRLELELLPPERSKKRPLFDIGPLDEVQASVVDVVYRDLRGRRRRRAAYGQLTVTLDRNGTVSGTDGYSQPERWEMP